jgi:cytosine/adenosine deaminase-related metal-dependent hydrolase
MTTQIVSARWVIPVEPAYTVLENHSVVFTNGTIDAILPHAEARTRYVNAHETVLGDHVLIPGLVNLHTHATMVLMRGLADDTPLMDWLQHHIWPAEAKYLAENYVYDGTSVACAEMPAQRAKRACARWLVAACWNFPRRTRQMPMPTSPAVLPRVSNSSATRWCV